MDIENLKRASEISEKIREAKHHTEVMKSHTVVRINGYPLSKNASSAAIAIEIRESEQLIGELEKEAKSL